MLIKDSDICLFIPAFIICYLRMRKFFVLFFKVLCFPYFNDKTRLWVGSSVPLLNGNSRSEHDYEFEHFSVPLPPIPPPKEREDEDIALKFPLVLASCGPCKHPKQILSSALGNQLPLFWLGSVSFSNLFLFSFPLSPSSDAPFKKLTPKLTECEPCFATSKES